MACSAPNASTHTLADGTKIVVTITPPPELIQAAINPRIAELERQLVNVQQRLDEAKRVIFDVINSPGVGDNNPDGCKRIVLTQALTVAMGNVMAPQPQVAQVAPAASIVPQSGQQVAQ